MNKLPRFTLRELFLLVVIAALGCAWWVEHRKVSVERKRLLRAHEEMWTAFEELTKVHEQQSVQGAERVRRAEERHQQMSDRLESLWTSLTRADKRKVKTALEYRPED